MTGRAQQLLYEIAEEHHGFVTSADAAELGWPARRLAGLASRGTLERVSTGVYRFASFPRSRFDEYIAASLWPTGQPGIVSHESVLDLLDLCDVNPARIHVTVPRSFRTRRDIPLSYELHHADIDAVDQLVYEGIRITTVDRAIRDCLKLGTGRHLLGDAIASARRAGWIDVARARELELLIGPVASRDEAAGA